MTRIGIIAMMAAILLTTPSRAATYDGTLDLTCFGKHHVYKHLPRFEDYPGERSSKQRAKDIDWKSHRRARSYHTRLSEGLREPPDFDGHYKVVTFGCGTGCQINWVIDQANGRAVGEFETSFGVSYHKDSALLIANPPDPACDSYPPIDAVTFYTVKNDKLVTVKRLDISKIWEKPNAGAQH